MSSQSFKVGDKVRPIQIYGWYSNYIPKKYLGKELKILKLGHGDMFIGVGESCDNYHYGIWVGNTNVKKCNVNVKFYSKHSFK